MTKLSNPFNHNCMSTRYAIKKEDSLENVLWYCARCGKIKFQSNATDLEKFKYNLMSKLQLNQIHFEQEEARKERLRINKLRILQEKSERIDKKENKFD